MQEPYSEGLATRVSYVLSRSGSMRGYWKKANISKCVEERPKVEASCHYWRISISTVLLTSGPNNGVCSMSAVI